jgi:TPR repeat protein
MLRYGQLLMQSDPGNEALLRGEAIPLLKAAAEAGEGTAHFLVGIAYGQLRDRPNARLWLLRAEELGDEDAARVLNEHGLR